MLWFTTTAFLEYTKLLHLDVLLKVEEYEFMLVHATNQTWTYQDYLKENHDCFFIRLITCPICLLSWLSILTAILQVVIMFTLGAPSAMFFSFPILVGYNTVLGLILFKHTSSLFDK